MAHNLITTFDDDIFHLINSIGIKVSHQKPTKLGDPVEYYVPQGSKIQVIAVSKLKTL